MELSTIPVTSIETGVIQEERSLEWKIRNFPVVLKHTSMINSQKFEFYAGDTIGMGSKWEAYLNTTEANGTTRAGFYIGLKEKPKYVLTSEPMCVQFIFAFKNKDGVVKKTLASTILDWHDSKVVPTIRHGMGFEKLFDVKGELPAYMELTDGSLVILVTFRIFALSKALHPLGVKLEEFQAKSKAKAREDLDDVTMPMGTPVVSNSVKVIANDKVEFWVGKKNLSARSPVFRAMLEADMTEGNAGVVEIQDMGSKSLKTMLHFMNRGELLPEWMSTEVVVELTNAAAKYELTDLLTFLDGVLGDVCTLDNVGMLITLASQLSLKTAEQDLMCFLRRKGANSSENFRQVLNAVLASEAQSGGSGGTSGLASSSSALVIVIPLLLNLGVRPLELSEKMIGDWKLNIQGFERGSKAENKRVLASLRRMGERVISNTQDLVLTFMSV